MTTPQKHLKMKRLALVLSMTVLAATVGPASAAALTGVGTSTPASGSHTTHPVQKRCRAHYVEKVVTVKKHKHGRVVNVKVGKCVRKKVQTPISKTISVTHSTPPTPPAVPTPSPTPAPTPAPAPPPTPAELVEVSVVKYTHISTANAYETPQAGNWFIAIGLTLTNTGSETVSSNANLDTTVIGTDSQTYTAVFDERKGCTNFDYGGFTLAPGATEVGCVVFELPAGMETQKIQFELEGFVRTFS